jgi:hypothetical protein
MIDYHLTQVYWDNPKMVWLAPVYSDGRPRRTSVPATHFTRVRTHARTRAPSAPRIRTPAMPTLPPLLCPRPLRFLHSWRHLHQLRCLRRLGPKLLVTTTGHAVALVREFTDKDKVAASHRRHYNMCNTNLLLKHPDETCATYRLKHACVAHFNCANTKIYFWNIQMKHLQHTSKDR